MNHVPPRLSRRAALATLGGAGVGLLAGCARTPAASGDTPAPSATDSATAVAAETPPASPAAPSEPTATTAPTPSAAEMAARAVVPVLCYHQVREWTADDSSYARESLICPPGYFREQLDAMTDAGYATITPEDYLAHLRGAGQLPAKPVLLTLDDGKDNQPETAFVELDRRGMKGTIYIMTVVLDKKGWISRAQVRELADAGHTIGSHTYDHQRTPDLTTQEQWTEQFVKSRQTLQDASGQPVDSFAYPYGLWAPSVVPHLVEAGYTTAFQLTETAVSADVPTFSLRRQLAVSRWSGGQVVAALDAFAERARAAASA